MTTRADHRFLRLIAAANKLRRDVPLGELARLAHRSPFDLHRLLRRLLGETPKSYLLRVRLARAAADLVSTDHPVGEVARRHGFANAEVFSRTFRARFGLTPTAYRARGLSGSTDGQAVTHAAVATAAAPCVGLYRLTTSEGNDHMPTDIAVKDLPVTHALIKRTRVARDDIATALSQILPAVFEAAQTNGIALAGPPFARYPEIGLGSVVIEAGFTVTAPPSTDLGDGIEALLIPAGTAAITIHRGPYDTLPATHAAIEKWALEQGRTLNGPPRETYVTDPGEYPDPATWETEIVQPIG